MTFEVKHQQLLSQFSVILNFRIKLDKVSVTGRWKPAEGKVGGRRSAIAFASMFMTQNRFWANVQL